MKIIWKIYFFSVETKKCRGTTTEAKTVQQKYTARLVRSSYGTCERAQLFLLLLHFLSSFFLHFAWLNFLSLLFRQRARIEGPTRAQSCLFAVPLSRISCRATIFSTLHLSFLLLPSPPRPPSPLPLLLGPQSPSLQLAALLLPFFLLLFDCFQNHLHFAWHSAERMPDTLAAAPIRSRRATVLRSAHRAAARFNRPTLGAGARTHRRPSGLKEGPRRRVCVRLGARECVCGSVILGSERDERTKRVWLKSSAEHKISKRMGNQ